MKTAAVSPLDMNRCVRRILVSHWIDLGRLSLHSVKKSVYIRGSLLKLSGSDSKLTTAVIATLYQKIQNVDGVSHVYMEFDNWTRSNVTGAWESLGAGHGKRKKNAAKQFRDQAGERYHIK